MFKSQPSHIEVPAGNIRILIPNDKAKKRDSYSYLSNPTYSIEIDMTYKLPKYKTNESIRNLINKRLHTYQDIFYLDANDDRLKIWTAEPLAIIRMAAYLNSWLEEPMSLSEITHIRNTYSCFKTIKQKNPTTYTFSSGLVDIKIIQNSSPSFQINGNLTKVYSDYDGHLDIEEEIQYLLINSEHFKDLSLESTEDELCILASSKESLLEAIRAIHQLISVNTTAEDVDSIVKLISL